MNQSRIRNYLVAALAAALMLAACGSGSDSSADSVKDPSTTVASSQSATTKSGVAVTTDSKPTSKPTSNDPAVKETCGIVAKINKLTSEVQTKSLAIRRQNVNDLNDLVKQAGAAAPDNIGGAFKKSAEFIDKGIKATAKATTIDEYEKLGKQLDSSDYDKASKDLGTWIAANCPAS